MDQLPCQRLGPPWLLLLGTAYTLVDELSHRITAFGRQAMPLHLSVPGFHPTVGQLPIPMKVGANMRNPKFYLARRHLLLLGEKRGSENHGTSQGLVNHLLRLRPVCIAKAVRVQ